MLRIFKIICLFLLFTPNAIGQGFEGSNVTSIQIPCDSVKQILSSIDFKDLKIEDTILIRKYQECNPQDSVVYSSLGYLYALDKQWEKAREYLTIAVLFNNEDLVSIYYLGVTLRIYGEYRTALELMTNLELMIPEYLNWDYYYNVSLCYYFLGFYKVSTSYYSYALQNTANNDTLTRKLRLTYLYLFSQVDSYQALRYSEGLISEYSENYVKVSISSLRAVSFSMIDDNESALKEIEPAIELANGEIDFPYWVKAYALRNYPEKRNEFYACLDTSLKLKPQASLYLFYSYYLAIDDKHVSACEKAIQYESMSKKIIDSSTKKYLCEGYNDGNINTDWELPAIDVSGYRMHLGRDYEIR